MNEDKWRELKIWVACNGDADKPSLTAEEAFKATWYKMKELEEESNSHG